jgi:hypothetical protein
VEERRIIPPIGRLESMSGAFWETGDIGKREFVGWSDMWADSHESEVERKMTS